MKDFLGKELKVGDEIVYMSTGYQSFHKGEIVKLTNKRIAIERLRDVPKPSWEDPTYRHPSTVVKI